MNPTNHLIVYDGFCGLCHASVQFVLRKDRKKQFTFVPLNSPFGKFLLSEKGINPKITDSIIYIETGKGYYVKSEAVLRILKSLGGIWSLFYPLLWIPKSISDSFYDFVAKRRAKWFGKKECALPQTDELHRFKEEL